MHILHLCQPVDGGTAVVARDLVRAGVKAGYRVTVACPAGGYLARWVVDAGAEWVEVPMSRLPEPRDLAHVRSIRRLMAEADVAHLHSSKAGAVGRLAASTMRRSRPRILFTPHGWSWYVGGRMGQVYRRFERWAGRVTDVITVVSVEELRDGRSVLRPGQRIELVENGVDTDAFAPDGPAAARSTAPLVVQVGRLSRQKAQDRTIRALAGCTDTSVRLRLIGDGPEEAALRALAVQLGVAERVEFAGSGDPRPHLRAADVVVLPSRWEGMSLVLLEAMAVGTAIIASDCGGSDALADTGVLITHADDAVSVSELSVAISSLLAAPHTRAAYASAARQRVEKCHSIRSVLTRYEALWLEGAST